VNRIGRKISSAVVSSAGEEQAAGQEAADLLELLHVARDHAGGRRFEIVDRQGQQVAEGAARQADVDLVGGGQRQDLAQEAEGGVEHQRDDDADGQHPQRRCALVHQHLVDHQLEEDRRGQREEVHRHRGQRDVAEGRLLLQDLGNEPAQAERLVHVGECMLALHEHHFAVPARAEFDFVEQLDRGAICRRVQDRDFRHAFVAHADHDHAAAVVLAGQEREYAALREQPGPAEALGAGLQADVGGDTQQHGVARLFHGQRVVLDQALRIDLQAVMLRDRRQALDGGMREFFRHLSFFYEQKTVSRGHLAHASTMDKAPTLTFIVGAGGRGQCEEQRAKRGPNPAARCLPVRGVSNLLSFLP
jgi:hypothetical protein